MRTRTTLVRGSRETVGLTVIACVSAAGGKIPPHIIAKGKTGTTIHGYDLQCAPEGSTYGVCLHQVGQNRAPRLWFESHFFQTLAMAQWKTSIRY
jgi:hypothetical protein